MITTIGERLMNRLYGAALGCLLLASATQADHSWGNYHWARTSNPFTLEIINSTTGDWDNYVNVAVSDWNNSAVINFNQTEGSTSSKDRRQCRGGAGTVRICNLAYGNNGWLGIAGISLDSQGHITTGYTKLNDTYFSPGSYYDTAAWRQSVTCQEIGHDLGLDHQDEDFNNASLKSCMDYQDPPWPNPNAHDYAQLGSVYAHLDSYNSYAGGGSGGGGGGGCNAPPGKGCNKAGPGNNGAIGWGMSIGRRGQKETFMRIDPNGTRHVTFVTWAIGH
jgi:hypothetical protein